jgi:predicted ribosomally synthesized peptide with nif11-like leader
VQVQPFASGQAAGLRSIMGYYPLIFEEQEAFFIKKFMRKEVIMSIESARAFVEKMRRDTEFKRQILAAESAAKRKELIKSAGFDFDRMHLESLVSELTPEERDVLMLL